MDRAGRATAEAARRLAADTGARILVVAGPGNNGGDAWVAAAQLLATFHKVAVLDATGTPPKAPRRARPRPRSVAARVTCVREWPADPAPALIVDGLLGIGLARDVDAPFGALIERMNGARVPVLAIDVPERPRQRDRVRARRRGARDAHPHLHRPQGRTAHGRWPRPLRRRGAR